MAIEILQIPLENTPQRFEIELDGKTYILECVYNPETPGWAITLSDAETNIALFRNQPLVAGVDLLAQYKHLEIGGQFLVYTDGDEWVAPTFENLGTESNLYYLVERADE